MISFFFRKNKKMSRRVSILLVVFVILVPAMPAFAVGGSRIAPPAGTTFVDVGSLPPTIAVSPSPETDGDEVLPKESPKPSESSNSSMPAESEPPMPSPTPEGERETGQGGSTESNLFAASRMLITGGHKAYMSGYAGNLFKPSKNMTRAEVAVALYNLLAAKQPVMESAFSDVSLNSWYGKEVNALHTAGVIGGYSDGTFRPNKEITRAEFVKLLTACFPMKSGSISFSDVSENYWAYSAIVSASAQGWIDGFSDGTFRPGNPLRRCDAAKILNIALERTGEGFAADRDRQEFVDVPKDHWAFEHIAEAADPIESSSPSPSPSPSAPPSVSKGYARVTATSGLHMRSGPGTSYSSLTILPLGTVITVLDTANAPWIQAETSSGTRGYVHQDYIVNYDPGSASSTTISLSNATIPQYKTLYLVGTVSPSNTIMQWKSSNENVATVANGFVYAKAPGTAVIIYTDVGGKSQATCNVTVTSPEAVRAAYTNPNVVSAGEEFKLMAVTDNGKTAVRFSVVAGGTGSWETSQYTTESRSAEGLPTNTVKIFERAVTFNVPGNYTLRAYSKTGNGDYSTEYAEFTVLVVSDYSVDTTTTEKRKASTEIIDIIAHFEGYVPTVYPDRLAGGIPTVGYGYVVPRNTTFYNNLTQSEAKAILADHVNSGGYASAVNEYRERYNLKMSQCQFDALVSFVYNLGSGVLLESSGGEPYYGTARMLLNSVVPPTSFPVSGTLNISDAIVYSEPKVSSTRLGTISTGSSVQVTGVQRNGKDNKEVWYQVSGSVSGWTRAGNIKLSGSHTKDLAYADAITFGNNLTQWNMADGAHIVGLFDRRMAEARLFSYGDYASCYRDSPGYSVNPGYTIPSWYH